MHPAIRSSRVNNSALSNKVSKSDDLYTTAPSTALRALAVGASTVMAALGVTTAVVPAPVAVSLKCLLRCLFLEMPFERLQQQTRVTRDVDRFASRYLVPLFRCACSCHMVSGDTVDKSLVPLCLETWLSQMTRNSGRNGFHLPN